MSFGMGAVLSMRLTTFAIAVLLLDSTAGAWMSTHPAQWLGIKAYAERKMGGEEAKKHSYVEFDNLSLPILYDNGLSQTVSFRVVIEVPDSQRAKVVEGIKPRLTDAFIHDMYGVWNKDQAYRDGLVHVDVIKDRLSRSSRRILGDENVNDIVLEVVDQRPM
jgi:flagellar protein FliL